MTSAALESPSDPKRAAKDLAEAVSDNVWIVDNMVASTAAVPVPTMAELAAAVLQTDSIHSPAAQRIGLLRRLAHDATNPVIRRAIRTLLTGRGCDPGEEPELYYVRSQDYDRDANRHTLGILLGLLGKAWSAVEAELVEPLPHALVEDLHVKTVDAGVLHRLLGECLGGITDWSRLDRPGILHLLQHLYATAADDRARWCAMPLHRGAGGERGSFDDRALRAVGEMRLPPELESEIRLLDPDREVANLYLDVPSLDDDGVLRAMLLSRRPQQFAEHIVHALRANRDGRVITAARFNTARAPAQLFMAAPPRRRLRVRSAASARRSARVAAWHRSAGERGGSRRASRSPRTLRRQSGTLRNPSCMRSSGGQVDAHQIGRLASALNPAKVAEVDGGAYLILPEAQRVSLC